MPPESWFWTHDGQQHQVNTVVTAGSRLIRLSAYGSGASRRFAGLVYRDGGPERTYQMDLDAAAATACPHPVAVTVDDERRFWVVMEPARAAPSSLRVHLEATTVRAALAAGAHIADLATYVSDGTRYYAVVLDERPGPCWLLAGVTAGELRSGLRRLHAKPTLIRAHPDEPRFTAVAVPADRPPRYWYTDLTGDQVASRLERKGSYPTDLDAIRTPAGVRFTVTMRRERHWWNF